MISEILRGGFPDPYSPVMGLLLLVAVALIAVGVALVLVDAVWRICRSCFW